MPFKYLDEQGSSGKFKYLDNQSSQYKDTTPVDSRSFNQKAWDKAKETAGNIIPDVVRNVKGIANIATDVIPQTAVNAIYNRPAIKNDAVSLANGVVNAIGQGATNLVVNPKQTIKNVGQSMVENPVTTATTAVFGIPGASRYLIGGKVAGLLDKTAATLGKRALGYTKPFLKTAEARQKATEVANTMLKEHVISNIGSTKVAMENVDALLSESGQALATIREGLQTKGLAFNPIDLDDKIVSKLMPKLSGGDFDLQKRTVDKIRRTILAGGVENVDFKTASDILDKLVENSKYSNVTATASQTATAKLYRKAAGIVSDEIDNAVENVAKATNQPNLLSDYLTNKDLYSKAKQAQKVLNNRLAGEEGNQVLGLKNALMVAGEIGSGAGIGKAVVTGGVLEGLKRFGAGMGAVETSNLANRARQIGKLGVPAIGDIKKGLTYEGVGNLGNEKGFVALPQGKKPIIRGSL